MRLDGLTYAEANAHRIAEEMRRRFATFAEQRSKTFPGAGFEPLPRELMTLPEEYVSQSSTTGTPESDGTSEVFEEKQFFNDQLRLSNFKAMDQAAETENGRTRDIFWDELEADVEDDHSVRDVEVMKYCFGQVPCLCVSLSS